MDWRWLLLQLLCAGLICLFMAARSRTSMQHYANELRRAAQHMSAQSQQLSSEREAANKSRKESQRRAAELQTLRDRVAHLSATNDSLLSDRDRARSEVAALRDQAATLNTRLAKADVRREALEKEIAAASLLRLELQSKLRSDESQRLKALNRLRQPSLAYPRSPDESRPSESTALSPLTVAKSPSESQLLSLEPDLAASDEEDPEMRAFEREGLALERQLAERLEMEANRASADGRRAGVSRVSLPEVELGKSAVSTGEHGNLGDQADSEKVPRSSPVSNQKQEMAQSVARPDAKTPSHVAGLAVQLGRDAHPDESSKFSADSMNSTCGPAVSEHNSQNPVSGGGAEAVIPSSGVGRDSEVSPAAESQSADMEENDGVHDAAEAEAMLELTASVLNDVICTAADLALMSGDTCRKEDEADLLPSGRVTARRMQNLVGEPARPTMLDESSLEGKESKFLSQYRELDETAADASTSAEEQGPGNTSRSMYEQVEKFTVLGGHENGAESSVKVIDVMPRDRRISEEGAALRSAMNASDGDESEPLSLDRLPWVDTLCPGLQFAIDPLSLSSALLPFLSEKMCIVTASSRSPKETSEEM